MNTSFSTLLSTLQIAWDSTSLGLLKECPRKYQYSIIEGWQPQATSVHLTFGIYYHKALEAYDHARSDNLDHEAALRKAVRCALEISWNKELNRPWTSGDSYKNRETLVRSVIWYLEHFSNDALKTIQLADGKPAVELSFRFNFPYEFETGEQSILCGHMDRLASTGNMAFVLDRKTTLHYLDDKFYAQFSPHNQMSIYTLAGKIIYEIPVQGVIIDGVQIQVGGSRYNRGFATRTSEDLEEFVEATKVYMAQAEGYATKNFWPMNETSCYNYGGCPFREVCSKPPAIRESILKTLYKKRVWDPLQIRGDI